MYFRKRGRVVVPDDTILKIFQKMGEIRQKMCYYVENMMHFKMLQGEKQLADKCTFIR